MTPHTVIAPIFPVMPGPPKFGGGGQPDQEDDADAGRDRRRRQPGKNAARYPTAEIAMATLPMASDTKYRKNVRK
jgi:hypothetical protein